MPKFLDTRGKASLAVGICDRCKCKFPLVDLYMDPNSPGLRVCKDDLDEFDPYRLPARELESVTLEFARPDVALVKGIQGGGITPLQAVKGQNGLINVETSPNNDVSLAPPVTNIYVKSSWVAKLAYLLGAQVTWAPAGTDTAALTLYAFLCVVPGTSGNTPPNWSITQGTVVQDNTVTWLNMGVFIP